MHLTVYRHLSCCIWHRELNDGLQRVDRMFQSYTRNDVIIFWWWSWDLQRGLHRQQREITSLSWNRLKRKLRIGFNRRAFARLRRITFREFHILISLWKGIIDSERRRAAGNPVTRECKAAGQTCISCFASEQIARNRLISFANGEPGVETVPFPDGSCISGPPRPGFQHSRFLSSGDIAACSICIHRLKVERSTRWLARHE